MVMQLRILVSFVLVLALTALAGCGDDDDDKEAGAREKGGPVEGTFVGKVRDTDAFTAIVIAPAAKGQDQRDLKVFVSDGRRLNEAFRGSVKGDSFEATSDDGDAKANGKVTEKAVTGTIDLPNDKAVRYEAGSAAATAGLYNLTVDSKGGLKGSSEAGVGLTGKSTLPKAGKGSLKLADGKSIEFEATGASGGESIRLKAGEARVIILADRKLRGAGKNKDDSAFVIRSSK